VSPEPISAELRQVLRSLRLSPMLDTLPERLALARANKMAHQDFLELVLSDEASRRESVSAANRSRAARLDPQMTLEAWDTSAAITYDHQLFSELFSLRFVEAGNHLLILGPVGVGKTHAATALGHVACRRRHSVVMARTDRLLKRLKASRLDGTYEAEMRRLIAVEVLVLDDFAIHAMDAVETADVYELVVERHRRRCIIAVSNREPPEWLATMADPLLAQGAVDRLVNGAHELVLEGESYRRRQKPRVEVG
jgi:DNA replication protein DnaC